MFRNHLYLTASTDGPLPLPPSDNEWKFLLIVFMIGMVAYIQTRHPNRIKQLFNALLSNRFIRQLVRDEQALTNRPILFLTGLYFFSSGLFLAVTQEIFDITLFGDRGIYSFTLTALCLFAFFVVKVSLVYGAGILLKLEHLTTEYLFHLFLFFSVLGLLLLPVSIAMVYLSVIPSVYFAYIGLILLIAFFCIRIMKVFYLGSIQGNFSAYHIILYICTLEILPLLMIGKPISDRIAAIVGFGI